MDNIVIIGAGGVGRETALIIRQINQIKNKWNILGFIDDNENLKGTLINGYKVLGGINDLLKMDRNIKVIVAIANYTIKKNIVKLLENRYEYANIIHPDVYIDESVKLEKGLIIYPGVILTTNIRLGSHIIISPKCGIGHDSIIEDYVTLLWNCNISGFDVLQEGCFIGSGATIIQNLQIGSGAKIGAGSVVIRDVNTNITIVGVPAKPVKH